MCYLYNIDRYTHKFIERRPEEGTTNLFLLTWHFLIVASCVEELWKKERKDEFTKMRELLFYPMKVNINNLFKMNMCK